MDLPLFKIDDERFYSLYGNQMKEASPQGPVVNGLEVVANKVVKYLLTIKGSDMVDPTYGCTLMEYTQITKNHLPRLQLELLSAIKNCKAFIQANEQKDSAGDYRLRNIELIKLEYGRAPLKDTVHIHLRITARSGKDALLEIPLKRS
jgi:phage baseplate assembly protein W